MIDDISEFEIMNSTKTEGILAPLPPPTSLPAAMVLEKYLNRQSPIISSVAMRQYISEFRILLTKLFHQRM